MHSSLADITLFWTRIQKRSIVGLDGKCIVNCCRCSLHCLVLCHVFAGGYVVAATYLPDSASVSAFRSILLPKKAIYIESDVWQHDSADADHAHDNNEGPRAARPTQGDWRDQGV